MTGEATRVYLLAKELHRDGEEVVRAAEQLGFDVTHALRAITPEEARLLWITFGARILRWSIHEVTLLRSRPWE